MKNASVGALQNLVKQFATPFDAIRELVQNSIDAGTSRIDVWCNYEFTDQNGVITIHIDDFGEGMDENIIDNQLTKLFASAKENDLTKIGKFGIGFVSVFALEPVGVLLHTGRGGEYWEVFFHPDRTYTKTKIDNPVEGTQITVFMEGSPAYYDEVVREVGGSLRKWCLYAEPEIAFENRADLNGEVEYINQEFGVDGVCPIIDIHEDGTEIALAFNSNPSYAFFNRGLTLAMDNNLDNLFPIHLHRTLSGLSIQIKSRYLEHTLSRDSVVRDENFDRAMKLLERSIETKLFLALFERLETLANQASLNPLEAKEYGRLLAEANRFDPTQLVKVVDQSFIRLLVGEPITPKALFQIYKETGRIPTAEDPTSMIQRASEAGVPTVWVSPPHYGKQLSTLVELANTSAPYSIWAILKSAFGRRVELNTNDFRDARLLFYDLEKVEKNEYQKSFLEGVRTQLEAAGSTKTELELVRVYPLHNSTNSIVFSERGTVGMERLSDATEIKSDEVYINFDHEHIQKIFELGKIDINLAHYMFFCAISESLNIKIPDVEHFQGAQS